MHIPKNGGSTFRDLLFKEFDDSEIFDLKIIDNTKMNKDDFINMSDDVKAWVENSSAFALKENGCLF